MNPRQMALRLIAEAQRSLLDTEARGLRMPRHEQRERTQDATDLLLDAVALLQQTVTDLGA